MPDTDRLPDADPGEDAGRTIRPSAVLDTDRLLVADRGEAAGRLSGCERRG